MPKDVADPCSECHLGLEPPPRPTGLNYGWPAADDPGRQPSGWRAQRQAGSRHGWRCIARREPCLARAQPSAVQNKAQPSVSPGENLTTTRTNQTVARAAKSLKYAITRKLSTNRLLRTSAQKIVDLACSNVDLAYSKRVENETLASRNSQHARLTSIGQADAIACLKLENRPDISAKDLERTNLEAGISWHHLPLN